MAGNQIESRGVRLLGVGLTLAGTALACDLRPTPTSPPPIYVVVTPIPEPGKKPPGEEKTAIPADLTELMSGLKTWRENLPEEMRIRIVDYGSQGLHANVRSEMGIKVRIIPDINSPVAAAVPWLTWGREFDFRYEIVKERGGIIAETWIVLDEKYDDLVRWQCFRVGPPGQGRCFVPARLGWESLIDIEPPRQNPTDIDWSKMPSP